MVGPIKPSDLTKRPIPEQMFVVVHRCPNSGQESCTNIKTKEDAEAVLDFMTRDGDKSWSIYEVDPNDLRQRKWVLPVAPIIPFPW